ncbi:PHD finger protein 20 [Daktulosphaira vitifoliae]|uniref:PHD finger protein 20 n=1 Tax=Daktulosphaira vitifoliae TaxID=58002 RepID=UPI0021AA2CF9|nr:PHD finger protein 20 [Daktulosphaira vitifoliae]
MDYDIGTELLIQSPANKWVPALVEEDDGDEIFISYKEGSSANEWINKDSHRIRSMTSGWQNNVENISDEPQNIIPDVKSITTEREITKKPVTGPKSASIFKVKFKKDDLKNKKDQKNKEIKVSKEKKKIAQNSKKPLAIKTSKSIKSTVKVQNISSTESHRQIKSISSVSKQSQESKLDNFEESLEDIEAEAEIISPKKSSMRGVDIKQKKKRKTLLGQKKHSEKRIGLSKNNEKRRNLLVVKLNANKLKRKNTSTPTRTRKVNHGEQLAKKIKLSASVNNAFENPDSQTPTSFSQIASNMLLQKIRMESAGEQGFRCPKQECRKLFRKENLLMMHIKHYHSEYTDLLVSTPNVTDLATARVEGEHVDDISPSYFLQRISQIEAKKTVGNTLCESPSLNTTPSTLKFPEQDLENYSFQSENHNSSYTSNDRAENITEFYDSKDSGFSGLIEPGRSLSEKTNREYSALKENKKLSQLDDYENEIYDNYDITQSSNRHFKIKKNKTEIESLRKEEVINCSCGSNQEDGLMIQCDVCLCWQHGYCNQINSEDQVPDNYVCNSCLNPSKKRRSKQYDYLQDWIKEGKVASVLQHKDERRKKDESILKQSHQLVAEVIEHSNFLHSLLVKTIIYGQTPDHPKLYLWSDQSSKKDDEPPPDKLEELLSGPVPEKPINTADCRKNLLEEIEDGFDNLEARINLFEAKTNGLEDQVNGSIDNEVLSNTVTMLLKDLNSIRYHLSLDSKNKESTNSV